MFMGLGCNIAKLQIFLICGVMAVASDFFMFEVKYYATFRTVSENLLIVH